MARGGASDRIADGFENFLACTGVNSVSCYPDLDKKIAELGSTLDEAKALERTRWLLRHTYDQAYTIELPNIDNVIAVTNRIKEWALPPQIWMSRYQGIVLGD